MPAFEPIASLSELEALYGLPGAPSLRKVAHSLTPLYRKWIMSSRFCTGGAGVALPAGTCSLISASTFLAMFQSPGFKRRPARLRTSGSPC